MLHITKMADYAVMLLCEFALSDAQRISARDAAARCGIGEPTAMKLLKLLAKAGVVDSVRGAGGGYTLSKPLDSVSVYDVIAAIDAPLAVTDCQKTDANHHTCEYKTQCQSQFGWAHINSHITDYLKSISIGDFIAMRPQHADTRQPPISA